MKRIYPYTKTDPNDPYETDALGSVNAVTDSSASAQNTYLYDAWGQVKSQTGPLANPFTYTSREVGEAGLNFYRARYYSSGIGRFLQEDPKGFDAGDKNFYRYVLNTPLMSTDPSGMFKIDGSCDCSSGPPPGATPKWGSQLTQGVIKACGLIDVTITDPKLRACMHQTCDSGTVECRWHCPPGKLGHTDFILPGVKNRTSWICANNWPDVLPNLENLILHEFAHGCNWEH